MYTKTCKICGKEFTTEHFRTFYCSEECKKAAFKNTLKQYHTRLRLKKGPIVKACPVCGKEFQSRNSRHEYCSKSCHEAGVRNKHSKAQKTEKTCPICGKTFVTHHSKKVFCSSFCRIANNNNSKKSNKIPKFNKYRKQKETVKKQCAHCGKEFETTKPLKKKYCSQACQIDHIIQSRESKGFRI